MSDWSKYIRIEGYIDIDKYIDNRIFCVLECVELGEGKVEEFSSVFIFLESKYKYTVCPGSSDPPEKIFYIFASENQVYTVF